MTLNFINSNLGKLIKTGAMTSLLLLAGCDSGSSIMGDGTEPMINYPGDSDLNITGQWRGRLAIAPNTPSSNYPGDESLDFALTFKQTGSGEEATLTAAMQFDFDSNASSNDNCLDFGDTNIELSMAYDSDGDGDVDSDDESYTHSGSASYTAQTATSPAAVRVSMNLHSGLQLDMDGTVSGSTISGSYSNWATVGTSVPINTGKPLKSISVTSSGSGYTQSTTTVSITAPDQAGGAQAAAVAEVTDNGKIGKILITNHGSGYFVAPVITITSITDQLESITVTSPGSGYTQSTTTVSISAPDLAGGTQATAVAEITDNINKSIGKILITNHGSGYYVAPVITITSSLPWASGAEATAELEAGGSGATATARLEPSSGSGATATAKLDGESGPITGCSAYAFTGSWSASR